MNHRSRGFTLIELLVVISIIGVLAALLLPTLKNAKARGQQVTCANNLRQIHAAFVLYAADYRDYIPSTSTLATVDSPGGTWCQQLGRAGYLGSPEIHSTDFGPSPAERWKVFHCPAESAPTQSAVKLPYWDYPYSRSSYAVNHTVSFPTWEYRRGFLKGPRYNTDLGFPPPKPSEAPFVTDTEDQGDGWTLNIFHDSIDLLPSWQYYQGYTGFYHTFRHPGPRANMLFMDGHVESVAPYYMAGGGKPNWRLLWDYPPP